MCLKLLFLQVAWKYIFFIHYLCAYLFKNSSVIKAQGEMNPLSTWNCLHNIMGSSCTLTSLAAKWQNEEGWVMQAPAEGRKLVNLSGGQRKTCGARMANEVMENNKYEKEAWVSLQHIKRLINDGTMGLLTKEPSLHSPPWLQLLLYLWFAVVCSWQTRRFNVHCQTKIYIFVSKKKKSNLVLVNYTEIWLLHIRFSRYKWWACLQLDSLTSTQLH